MQLFLLNYNKYQPVFENYVNVANPSSKYALAKLMSNIKTEGSRNLLIRLLNDKHSIVQGEVVRQLKNEPAEIVAPILLSHLTSANEKNFGPSNIMDPVMNSVDGGKTEIIRTLGELKYQPAVAVLLPLLETDNDYLFELVIGALKDIGTREYIPYINRHLDNKTAELIFKISMLISHDSLVECLPSLKNFIATCNRNRHPSFDYTLSSCCGIAHFKTDSVTAFLLSDYKHFLTYADTLESGKQKDWTQEYIDAFIALKVKEARPLIYSSIYKWHGLNQDFGTYPELFKIKQQLEDSLKIKFAGSLEKKGYRLNHCIAFIQNSSGIITGAVPEYTYLIEVSMPDNDKPAEHQEIVMKELNLPKENVHIRYKNGWYYLQSQDKFDDESSSNPLYVFLNYARALPNQKDVDFLQALLDSKTIKGDYYSERVGKTINDIKEGLKK